MRFILLVIDMYNFFFVKWFDEKLKFLFFNQYIVIDNFDFIKEIYELKINKGEILVLYDVFLLFMNVFLDEIIEILVNRVFLNNWFNIIYNFVFIRIDFIDFLNVVIKG